MLKGASYVQNRQSRQDVFNRRRSHRSRTCTRSHPYLDALHR